MVGRVAFWLIVGILFWLGVRLLLRAMRPLGTRNTGTPEKASDIQIPMLQCAYCGVHLPAVEAVTAEDGRVFCTRQHEQLAHHPDAR
jgi:uncharacterized protein